MSDANTIATVVPILSNQAPPTPPANSTTKEPNSFIRLVRSISRSSPRSSTSNTTTSKSHGRKSSTSQSQSLQQSQGYSPSLATSPPPGKSHLTLTSCFYFILRKLREFISLLHLTFRSS